MKIGVTGLVTFKRASKVHEVIRKIPLDKILLETDSPYFLPPEAKTKSYPYKFSLPGHVLHVATQVAALKAVNLRVVLEQNLKNVKEIYKVE